MVTKQQILLGAKSIAPEAFIEKAPYWYVGMQPKSSTPEQIQKTWEDSNREKRRNAFLKVASIVRAMGMEIEGDAK